MRSIATITAILLLASAKALRDDSAAPDKPLGFSIGIAIHELKSDETIVALIKRADGAMYKAKRAGKGNLEMAPSPSQSSAATSGQAKRDSDARG